LRCCRFQSAVSLSDLLLGFHSWSTLLATFISGITFAVNFVRSFLITNAVQAPAEVAPMAACVAAAMQTGHISYSSSAKTVWFPAPTMSWLLSGRDA
jgi:hypothetical protein